MALALTQVDTPSDRVAAGELLARGRSLGATFTDVAPKFLHHYQLYSEDARTMPSQVRVLERHFGDRLVAGIDVGDIEEFFRARLAEGIGRATLNRQASALSVFLEWCTTHGYRSGVNPALAVRRFKEGDGRDRFLTPDEAERLLAAAAPTPGNTHFGHHTRAVILTALHTGGRLNEVLRLTWEYVNLHTRVLTFARLTTKGKMHRRHIPISRQLAVCLQGLPLDRQWPGDPVFRWRGRAMHDIRSSFEGARLRAGLGPDVTFHTLRHTFASWYVMNGGSLRVLQTLMGHTTIVTTERYSHLSPAHIMESVRFIGPPRAMPVVDARATAE